MHAVLRRSPACLFKYFHSKGKAVSSANLDVEREFEPYENFGSLISRLPENDWLKEVYFLSDRVATKSKAKANKGVEKFMPDSVCDLTRIHDREAGDDEVSFFRSLPDQVVCDTKLIKARASNGFQAIKLAGPDTLIDIIRSNHKSSEINVWREILSRIDYIAPTLSVKKIRLLLDALAKADPQVELEAVYNMVESLGKEILCRFHALTLWSCCSISESLASLGCCHKGTLNILALAWKQNLEENTYHEPSPERLVDMCVRMLSAYAKLKLCLPLIVDSVVDELIKNHMHMDFDQRLNIIETLVVFRPDILDKEAMDLNITNEISGLRALNSNQKLRFFALASKVKNQSMLSAAKTLFNESVIIAEDGKRMVVKQETGADEFGKPKFTQNLVTCNHETLRIITEILDDTCPQRTLIDRILDNR